MDFLIPCRLAPKNRKIFHRKMTVDDDGIVLKTLFVIRHFTYALLFHRRKNASLGKLGFFDLIFVGGTHKQPEQHLLG